MKDGYIKVASASPVIRVADAHYNAQRVIETMERAAQDGVKVLVFPELTLTGACCYDLFGHRAILEGAKQALLEVVDASFGLDVLSFVGLPVAIGSRLYSVAAAVFDGSILGLVPRKNVRGSVFASPVADYTDEVHLFHEEDYAVPFSAELLFGINNIPGLKIGVQVGADMDARDGGTLALCVNGASILARMASFPETVYSTKDAVAKAVYESKYGTCGILTAAPGRGESSTDYCFSGLCLAAENGELLAQCEGEDSYAVTEFDIDLLMNLRRAGDEFDTGAYECISVTVNDEETELTRPLPMYPHLPADKADWPAYCERMLDIQVNALVKRMKYAHLDHCVIGISGGVDSTLAVIVASMAVRQMGLPGENVIACTLPCFGTSSRTKSNAIVTAEQLGCEVRVIDIGKSVYQHFDDIGHAHDDYSVAYENAQARERTQVLMDIANKVNGLDVGTEDLSEFVDGWCTYNGDHTSMYDVNMGMTKTQVRANVRYVAETTKDAVLAAALWDVLDCPVTPELLPILNDEIIQKSEDSVGSYSLQDFFTHKMLICGFLPSKVFRLARIAYRKEFTDEELLKWLTSYCKRLFSQQFKRSCLMDGPCVEAFSVSPRVGFLIPSDAEAALFLADLESIEIE